MSDPRLARGVGKESCVQERDERGFQGFERPVRLPSMERMEDAVLFDGNFLNQFVVANFASEDADERSGEGEASFDAILLGQAVYGLLYDAR
jgi:hypothetical protein